MFTGMYRCFDVRNCGLVKLSYLLLSLVIHLDLLFNHTRYIVVAPIKVLVRTKFCGQNPAWSEFVPYQDRPNSHWLGLLHETDIFNTEISKRLAIRCCSGRTNVDRRKQGPKPSLAFALIVPVLDPYNELGDARTSPVRFSFFLSFLFNTRMSYV